MFLYFFYLDCNNVLLICLKGTSVLELVLEIEYYLLSILVD